MNIELTLSADYQRNEWGVAQALRELISNALDGQERGRSSGTGTMSFDYNRRSKVLTITNKDTTVPVDALLMGSSRSRENDDCIGQFGEGLPMSLLVLARKGVQVVIYNGDEKWTPEMVKSVTFGGAEVLSIKRRQMIKPRTDFVVEVHDMEAEEVEEMERQFLLLDRRFDPEMTVSGSYFSKTRVLLQDEYKGRIYNKGVFVTQRQDLSFGYDISAKLNRDRSIIDDYDLRSEIGHVLSDALTYEPEKFVEIVFPAIFETDGLETGSEYGSLSWSDKFADLVAERWVQTYGSGVLAVRRPEEIEDAARIGAKAVIASSLVRKIVNGRYGSLTDLEAEAETKVLETFDLSTLTPDEHAHFDRAEKLLYQACPAAKNRRVEIARFGGTKRDYVFQDNVAYISRWTLADARSAMKIMARVGCEVEGNGSMEQQVDILARMAAGR
jgi:hypothetical protein